MQNRFLIAPVYILLFSSIFFLNANALDYKAYGFIQPEITSFLNGDGRHNQSNKNFSAFAKGTFVTYLNNNNTKITLASKFEKVKGWDSLGHMKIISEIEKKLSISFEIDEIIGINTIKKLIELTKKKIM